MRRELRIDLRWLRAAGLFALALLSPRTTVALVGLGLLGAGLAQVNTAAALAVPGALLFLIAVPAQALVCRPPRPGGQ